MLTINFKKVSNNSVGLNKEEVIQKTKHKPVLSPLSPSKKRGKPSLLQKSIDMRSILSNQPSLVLSPVEKDESKKKSRKRKKKKKKSSNNTTTPKPSPVPAQHIKLFKDAIQEISINKRFTLQICRDPVEYQKTDVLVCPTQSTRLLLHESDIGKQIVHRGGYGIQKECDQWIHTYGRLTEGVAVSTGGHLRARYIVYPKLPIYFGAVGFKEDKCMLYAIYYSLLACHKLLSTSCVLPLFSQSTFDFPMARGICLLYHAILLFWSNFPDTPLQLIRISTGNNLNHQHLLELEHVRRFGMAKKFIIANNASTSVPSHHMQPLDDLPSIEHP